eukprot:gene18435-24141_t
MKLAIHHFESVDSTNQLCKHYSHEGSGEGTVVIANTQTAGKGRQGRIWVSEIGNLYTSILLTPGVHDNPPPIKSYGQLAFMTGLGVLKGLQSLGIQNVQLKWPNDGLYDGKKLFGILIECIDDAVIVGIGINVNHAPETSQPTVCVKDILGSELDIADVFHAILKFFWQIYREWLKGDFSFIRSEYLTYALGFNTKMTLNDKEGIFTGISDDGCLLLTETDGIIHKIIAL